MIGNKDLVSVLIPAYNHENYVQETIKSIINQTYKNIELIVIDDGSKDSTWQKICEIKEECKKRFSNVTFETKENEGSCKTLNKLLSYAKGEYVYIIASDDLAKPQAIEKEVGFLSNNPDYSLVVGDNEIIDNDGIICYWNAKRENVYDKKQAKYLTFCDYLQQIKPNINFNSNDFGTYNSLFLGNYIPNGYLIRKSILDKTGYFTPEAPLEDYWLMLQISKYSRMKYLDEILFSYRWHTTNTVKNIEKMLSYTKKTIEHEKQIIENTNEEVFLKDVIAVKKYGVCYKKLGIPFIFQILTYKRFKDKIKIVKLFNVTVFRYTKES